MFFRCKARRQDGKAHHSWSLVENRRVRGGRVVQRPVLYLGEINDSQQAAWRRTIEAHIFVAFIASCLQATLKQRLRALAPGLTPRAVFDKLKAMQMVDVELPTTDGRQIVLPRYTQPNKDQQILPRGLGLTPPPQPPPRITARAAQSS